MREAVCDTMAGVMEVSQCAGTGLNYANGAFFLVARPLKGLSLSCQGSIHLNIARLVAVRRVSDRMLQKHGLT